MVYGGAIAKTCAKGYCKLKLPCRTSDLPPHSLQMGTTKGLGPLAMYVNAEEGVCFQTDNGLYLCSVCIGMMFRIQPCDVKDTHSKFYVSLLPNGKVLLQDYRNVYLCWTDEELVYLDADKCAPDEYCEFEVFHDEEKVLFKASNGLFVCRTYRYNDLIEVSHPTMDNCCRFRTAMGDMYAPSLDISQVVLSDISNLACKPCVVRKETFVNKLDTVQSHSFTLTWETRTQDTTEWETTWGLNTTTSSEFDLKGVTVSVTYNGHFKKVATTNRSIVEKRSITVDVPQHRKITAMLVVHKIDKASIPFTALIRKTKVIGETLHFEEKGVWRGLVYDNITVETKEEPAWDNFTCQAS
ncbi:uncharacterized protein RB166_019905 [Leptodactylus fuscus]